VRAFERLEGHRQALKAQHEEERQSQALVSKTRRAHTVAEVPARFVGAPNSHRPVGRDSIGVDSHLCCIRHYSINICLAAVFLQTTISAESLPRVESKESQ